MKVHQQLTAIIERSSTTYMKKHLDKYLDKINNTTKQWRKWVRQKLSVQYVKGTKNTSLYPMLRTGALRNSLVARKAHLKSTTKMVKGRARAEIVIPISYAKLKDDYGEKLNSSNRFYNKTFFNWKGRVQEELANRIKGRI